MENVCIDYEINFLINYKVHDWILSNRKFYDKVILVSASPDFFVKKILTPLNFFDEIYGSVDVNLKGIEKLKFIRNNWGENFDYIADSADDEPIFKASKNGFKVTGEGIINAN